MRTTALLAALLFILAGTRAWAAVPLPYSIGDLASELQTERDVCANLAKEAKKAYSLAQYQSDLDRDTAALKAEMDARVYGVGHGRRQTAEYYAQRRESLEAEQRAKDEETEDAFSSAGETVAQCLVALEQKGKDKYIAFKQRHAESPVGLQAEALMVAWLTNVLEISTSEPDGGDASLAAWKAAKAHAEVTSL